MRYGKVQHTGEWMEKSEGYLARGETDFPVAGLSAMGGAKKQAEKGKSMRAVGLEPTT